MDEQALDVVKESMNIGVGEAASSLSDLVGAPVTIKVPEVRIINVADVAITLGDRLKELGIYISQKFTGTLQGKVILAYSQSCALSLINCIYGNTKDISSLTKSDIATLEEIGNILIISYLSTLSNMIEAQLDFALPQVRTTTKQSYFEAMIADIKNFDRCIIVINEMTVKKYDILGYLFILMSVSDLDQIIVRMQEVADKHLEGLK